MLHIDFISFGKVVVSGQSFKDILIIEEQVIPRNKGTLKAIYGTSHLIRKEEVETLLKGKPEAIVIGTGFAGMVRVDKDLIKKLEKKGSKVYALNSRDAVNKFNELAGKKRVNALIHTTC